jgi:hypothetical protein
MQAAPVASAARTGPIASGAATGTRIHQRKIETTNQITTKGERNEHINHE